MMAATIQTPAQQPPPTTNNNTSPANPKLKRIVYSKYRELLGSYNDKANAIIESLPAYMVKEDRGFHFDPKIIDEVDKVVYGTPPAPPSLSTGSGPTQRMSTQMPQYNVGEAPACVQNAMMTKDKKPFTYTPGGIDLSQIKSQRMAKRLARNAQCEGATGQQQMNRPPQQSNGGTSPAAAAQLGATAMGMPFQVLPTGPPPPPPQPNKIGGPPPPPPAPQNKLAPQSNGNAARKSPTPQNFEPPPMGFRPEIKIPPNPMAALKKVPPPQEKNNFWMEEYRKERSKSPMVGNDENDYNRSPPNNPQPETNQNAYNNYNNNSQQNEYRPSQTQNRSPSPQPMRQQQEYYTQRAPSPPRTPVQQLDQQRRIENPYQTQYLPQPQQQSPSIQRQTSQHQSQYQPQQSSPQQQQSPPVQRQQIVPPQQYQGPTSPQYQQQTSPTQQQPLQQQQQQQQSVPWRSQRQPATGIPNNVSRPRDVMSPAPSESPRPQAQQQQQQYPAYLRSREVLSPAPELQPPQMSQPYLQKNSQVGSIYIPPVANQQQQQLPQQLQQQQSASRQVPANRWVSAQPTAAASQPMDRIKSPPPPSNNGLGNTNNNPGLRLLINNNTSSSNAKERIIPIQLEHTPTPTRTPAAPGFGPQPFYNANQQQYSSVPSPPLAQGATSNGQNSPSYIVRSPNQFVDQGYNNYPGSQDPNRVTSPTMQQMQSPRLVQQTNTAGGVKTRIIPIAIDSQPDGPLNPNNVRGPISQQPLVIQNDPRNQNSWGNGSATPNQSKSFRILQKITDTTDDGALESKPIETDIGNQEPQLQRPSYARQMGPGQVNSPSVEQMKRMQLNNEQAFANRARNQDDDKESAVKAANEDPRYRGPSNPSKTFQKLQGAVERCSPSRTTDKDGNSPVMKQPQPNRYINQRPVYSPEEQPQQYVHPSEQQVPEPKKYTGSAIPSRSFKILQAMTTPENAAEMEGSDVVESNKSITECPYQQPHPSSFAYPYPYMPQCCPLPPPPPPPSSSSGGDVNNWQYPLPCHHPHQHQSHHPYQHHPYPPCPYYYYYPPNEYDSQNCSPCQSRDSFSRCSSQSQDLPNIIITPSAEEIPQVVKASDLEREQREGSVIDILSRRLSEISNPVDVDLNMSQEDDKKYVGDCGKEFDNSPSPIKSECENNKISSEDSSDDLLTSSTEPSTTSSFEDCAEQLPTDGLQAIKSVTNIQVYNKNRVSPMDDDDHTIAEGESMAFDDDEDEDEIVGEELEYDEEEVIVEEIESEEEDDIEDLEEDEEEGEVIIMDDLSVIYEENEADLASPRPASRISSSVSDSTTLANEECQEEEEGEKAVKEDDDDDNSNSVTVRLPLKFSFSRSSNDENIATVEVGNSQIEDKRRSFSIASVEADFDENDSDSQDCDVSVTISLSPSSGSFDRKSSLSPVPKKFGIMMKEEVREEDMYESEAEDVSVSFSLPMRNKFLGQTLSGDLTNNIAKRKKKNKASDDAAIEAWRRNSSEAVLEESEEKAVDLRKENDFWAESSAKDYKAPTKITTVNGGVFEDEEITEATEVKKIKIVDSIEEMSGCKGIPMEKEEEMIEHRIEKQPEENVAEELDFWATLQATRKEAQLFLEKTANYWGKKIDGKEKAEANQGSAPTNSTDPTAIEKPLENQTEEDFWATIRVKDNVEKVEAAVEEPVEPKPKKQTTSKTAKPKKKKKIIKAAEKEPEPEHVWSTISLPNANNRAKIVESTIKMIQDKAKKSKEAFKAIKTEVEVGDFVASIKSSFDKEYIEETNYEEASPSIKETCDKEKTEEVSITPPKKQIEALTRNLVKEKAELKTQILNQKFAKAFVLPDKPALMKALWSESKAAPMISSLESVETSKVGEKWEFSAMVSSPIAYESESSKKSAQPVEIVIEESEKLDKPKKKVVKAKKVAEGAEGDTLKPPKRTVKKSSKESKKIKKKMPETEVKLEEFVGMPSIAIVEESIPKIEKQVGESDFWAEIESSKSILSEGTEETTRCETNIREGNEEANRCVANIQDTEDMASCKTDYQETDFWSVIESSQSNNEADTEQIDFCSYDEPSNAKDLIAASNDHEGPDFWAEIENVNAETIEETTEAFVIWNDVEPSESKTSINAGTWNQLDVSEPQYENNTEVYIAPPKAQVDTDFWSEIHTSTGEMPQVETMETDVWPPSDFSTQNDSITVKNVQKYEEPTDFWAEIETSDTKINYKVELPFIPMSKPDDSKPSEPKIKKKSKKTIQESDLGKDSEPSKPKTKKKSSKLKDDSDTSTRKSKKKPSSPKEEQPSFCFETELESSKPKSKKKNSLPTQESTESIDFWAQIETSRPKKSSTKVSSLQVYGDYDVEFINLEPVSTYYALHTQPEQEIGFWATVSYAEDTFLKPKVFEEPETDFWASNSSGNETEVNSEVDTGKIDFWVTQRKFETNGGFAKDTTPKVEEESGEVDFWAEIKGSNEDEVQTVLPKDECELRRNNYKKAMAFFTNTVNVDKKEQSPAVVGNIDSSAVYDDEKTPEAQPYNSWAWRESVEHEWEAPEEREVNDVFLVVEDNETEEDTLIESHPYEMEEGFEFEAIDEEQGEEEEEAAPSESSESITDSTPNHFQIEHEYPKPELEPIMTKEKSIELVSNKFGEEIKISVKDRIFAFETGTIEPPSAKPKTALIVDSATPKSNLSRNSSQRSESEIEEDDSGVTDMNKPLSETDTESESFPELRKMTRYQRASTHSRLFKLLQDENDVIEEESMAGDKTLEAEFNFKPRKKIVHNVSITRKQNPKALQEAESMTQRRERLSLPLRKNPSIDADNLSSPNSPASPIFGQPSQAVSDKLVNELVQSLLLKKSSSTLKSLPMEKLQAAAKRVLEEELDSLENTSLDSTPALTPQEFKSESYSDYYDSWSAKTDSDTSANGSFEILPSNAFKALQETTANAKRRPWAVRCPRVLSSKTVNRDLARVTESPEIYSRSSNSPEVMFGSERASSVGRWKKI